MKIALISDIHEDVVSLEKALKAIDRENCNEIFCLGDILGFSELYYQHISSRNASECIRLIKQNCSIVLLGNHDLNAIKKIPHFTKGFEFPENWYKLDFNEQEKFAGNKVWLYNDGELDPLINEQDKAWMNCLSEWASVQFEQRNIFLSHYIYPNLSGVLKGFYLKNEEFIAHKEFLFDNGCDFSIAGHSHFPGLCISSKKIKTKRFNRTYKVNRGDCILIPPIVDNRNGSGFCIFDTNSLSVTAKTF